MLVNMFRTTTIVCIILISFYRPESWAISEITPQCLIEGSDNVGIDLLSGKACKFINNSSNELNCKLQIVDAFDDVFFFYIPTVLSRPIEYSIDFVKLAEPGFTVVKKGVEFSIECLGALRMNVTLSPTSYPLSAYFNRSSLYKTDLQFMVYLSVVHGADVLYGNIELEFESLNTLGVSKTEKNCDGREKTDCLVNLKVLQKLVVPDFTLYESKYKGVEKSLMEVYRDALKATIRSISLSTSSTEDKSSVEWIQAMANTSVRRLNASNNDMRYVADDTFGTMDNLEHLSLKNCRLKYIENGSFTKITNLHHLDLAENMLSTFPDLKGLEKLQELNLSSQNVEYFNLIGVEHQTNLQKLILNNVPLKQVDRFSMLRSTILEYLNLKSCQIEHLNENTFWGLTNLKTLNLADNFITQLPPLTFKNVAKDAEISVNSNYIKNVENLTLNNILSLDLSNNEIDSVDNIILTGFISNLDLNGNKIVNWTSNFTHNSPNFTIKNVNLSYNFLISINSLMIPAINTLQSIDIGANPFDCNDCSLLTFQNWLKTHVNTIYNLDSNDSFQCVVPLNKKGELIVYSKYNEISCVKKLNYAFIISISVLMFITIVTVLFLYIYRFEAMYIRHLLRVRRKSERSDKIGCKFDVFVSYCSKDRDWVLEVLLPELEEPTTSVEKYTLCLHERDFLLGTYIMDNVVSCIDQSRRVLIVLTPNFIKSEWCQWEVQMAQHRVFERRLDFLVLLELERLERASVPLHLRLLMDSRTYLEWPAPGGNLDNFWARLRAALGTPLDLTTSAGEGVEEKGGDSDEESMEMAPFVM